MPLDDPTNPHLFNREGESVTFYEWLVLSGDTDYTHIATTHVGPYIVSTIWLGLDLAADQREDGPLIYETMVFRDRKPRHGLREQHSTEAEARAAHERIADDLRRALETSGQ